MRDIIVTSPEHLGSHVVFKAKSVTLHPSWSFFKGEPDCLHTRVTFMHAVPSQVWESGADVSASNSSAQRVAAEVLHHGNALMPCSSRKPAVLQRPWLRAL